MLGRNSYEREEVDHAKSAVAQQLTAFRSLTEVTDSSGDEAARAAASDLESTVFNNMVLVLDRYFVHRVRGVTGKDGNPLNEVELYAASLMDHDGVFTQSTVLKLVPDDSVLKIAYGDQIALSADDFERLSDAFFTELEAKFV